MYLTPSNHNPRSHPSRAMPTPSRSLGGGGTRLPGVTVYGPRQGVSPVRTPPALPGNYRTAPRTITPESVPARVRERVERAFPYGPATPRPGYGWSNWAGRFGSYAAVGEAAYRAADEVADALDVIGWVLDNGAWPDPDAGESVAPGMTFIGARAHTGHVSPGNYSRGNRYGESIQLGNPLPVPQNAWLLQTTLKNQGHPNGFWNAPPSFAEVPNGWYWIRTIEDYTFRQNATSDLYRRSVEVYRNNTGAALAPMVSTPAFPLPLGVPLPASMPEGYPLIAPRVAPRVKPLPRPVRIPEVAISIPPGPRPVPRVYPARPRRPGKKAKERKFYGKAGAYASGVYWLYEATDDWVDWLDILINAIPGAPTYIANSGPIQQMKWLRDNPEMLAQLDMGAVISGLAGWLVDEAFGAFVGNVNQRANRGISTSKRTTVDMRTNVVQHYSPSGGSPGSFTADFINAFL